MSLEGAAGGGGQGLGGIKGRGVRGGGGGLAWLHGGASDPVPLIFQLQGWCIVYLVVAVLVCSLPKS